MPLSGPMKTPAPMLAVRHPPFSNKDWVFELKHDGYRALAVRQGERVELVSRNAHSLTDAFPDLTYPLSHLPCTTFVLDGEIVCLDSEGRSVFSRLQGRASLETEPERLKAAISTPRSEKQA